jgi:hypothetical protein
MTTSTDIAFRTELAHRLAVHPDLAQHAIAHLKILLPLDLRECLSTARISIGQHCTQNEESKMLISYSGWAFICHAKHRKHLERFIAIATAVTGIKRFHIFGSDLHIRIWHSAAEKQWIYESVGGTWGGSANAHG